MRSARIELILDTLRGVRGAKQLAAAVDETADALASTAREGDKAGRAIDDAGDQMSESARAAARLDREIDKLSGSLRQMAISQALTGENFGKQIREQESQIRRLTKDRKLFGDVGDEAAVGFASRFSSRIGPLLASAPISPGLLAAVGGAAIVAAPVLVSALSAAVSAGIGAGVLGVGVALAAQDPVIKARGVQLGHSFVAGLQEEASDAFQGPLMASLNKLELAGQRTTDRLGKSFDDLAPHLGPLTDDLIRAGETLTTSLANAASNSGPALDALGDSVVLLSGGVSKFIDVMSSGGPEAASNLRLVAGATGDLIAQTGILLNFWSELANNPWITGGLLPLLRKHYDDAAGGAKNLGTWVDPAARGVQGVGAAAGTSAAPVKTFAERMDAAAAATKSFSDKIDALFNDQMSLDQADIKLRDGMVTLHKELTRGATTLSLNSVEGRKNRTAVLGQLSAIENLRTARFKETGSVTVANTEYNKNVTALRKAALAAGFNKGEVDKLFGAYRKIPGTVNTKIGTPGLPQSDRGIKDYDKKLDNLARKINTSVTVTGDRIAYAKLQNLLIQQNALKKGISVSASASAFRKNAFDTGGWTGPGSKYQPAGVVHADEFVIQKSSRQKIERRNPGLLDEMNATGQIPGYAGGGPVINAPFPVNASITKIMTLAEALSKVAPSFGNWPSSPSAQRGDSGVWRRIVALIRGTGPMSGSFGNAYRRGDPLWHGSGRAVDWMGFNQDRLASFLAARRPLELIHRTARRDYAYTRGVNKGSFNSSLMQAHRNHVHIAMGGGGIIPEHVIGVGRSGRTYEFAERGRPEVVTPLGAGAGMTMHNTFNINGANQSVEQIAAAVGRELGRKADLYARAGG